MGTKTSTADDPWWGMPHDRIFYHCRLVVASCGRGDQKKQTPPTASKTKRRATPHCLLPAAALAMAACTAAALMAAAPPRVGEAGALWKPGAPAGGWKNWRGDPGAAAARARGDPGPDLSEPSAFILAAMR